MVSSCGRRPSENGRIDYDQEGKAQNAVAKTVVTIYLQCTFLFHYTPTKVAYICQRCTLSCARGLLLYGVVKIGNKIS